MAVVILVPIVVKIVLIVLASVPIAATAPKAITEATSAYSIRSWPDSSLRRFENACLKFFVGILPIQSRKAWCSCYI